MEAPARPLADRLRPRDVGDLVGQEHLTGEGGAIARLLEAPDLPSLILWGPPGTGKTSFARALAASRPAYAFEPVSAIFSGVADLRKAFEAARLRCQTGQGTLLFVDEIHRFNKAQQDSFLPVMEDGTVTLIGATTENPSFALNSALLSRARVLTFRALDEAALERLLARAEANMGEPLPLTAAARHMMLGMADGDGRAILTLAEDVWRAAKPGEVMDEAALAAALQRRAPLYDKAEEGHYNLVSALHKCVRGSDPDAALYYFCRMVEAGEDPRFLARRLVRMAVEDIGLADPQALIHARAAADAFEQLGSPEGELALANCVLYLATAPKSNAAYVAFKAASRVAKDAGSLMPPKTILNAPTRLMKNEGYGSGYAYDHDEPHAFSGQDYWPENLGRQRFYTPPERGFEREILKRLEFWERLRRERKGE
ncbi:MAG: replication-associated recombination protein A [Methylobacterium sp.]